MRAWSREREAVSDFGDVAVMVKVLMVGEMVWFLLRVDLVPLRRSSVLSL